MLLKQNCIKLKPLTLLICVKIKKRKESTRQLDVDTEQATFVRGANGAGDSTGEVGKAGAVEFNVDAGDALVPRAFRQFLLNSPDV